MGGDCFPATFVFRESLELSELSIFIDESGDFGAYEPHAPYYFLTLVFHDQSRDISERIEHLKRRVVEAGFPREHAIHCAPLVRREDDYKGMGMDDRRRLFRRLYDFARICDIRYKTFVFEKREYPDHDALVSRMSREVGLFVRDNLAYFQSFDHVIVYYDNGQKEITNLVNAVFNVLLEAEVRKVRPSEYCLFQAADMFCTLELARRKMERGGLSKSERDFYQGQRNLKKNYLKSIERKRL